jgi:hypothetical protein
MIFEISGKGIVCNVYYIEREVLDDISELVTERGPSLKQMLQERSDYIVNVSKGFFSDNSLSKFNFKMSSGETIGQDIFEKRVAEIALQDDEVGEYFEEGEDPRDFKFFNHYPRSKDITESQVAIIEYHEFENGVSTLEIPCEDKDKIMAMRLMCDNVDAQGPAGEEDLATTATYRENVVGGEEYEHAELPIMSVELDGEIYPLPEAKFDSSHSRVWLWVYDEEDKTHGLDFFGSQELPDPWVLEMIDLNIRDIKDGFDQDLNQLLKVHKFFNQKDLDWIKNNKDFVSQYQTSHKTLKHLMSAGERELQLPVFKKENVKFSTCTLLCMFFDAFGVEGYDPEKLSQLDEADMHLTDFEMLALGNKTLLTSVQKSFCMHFNVIGEMSLFGEESFSEMSHPTLADAVEFVVEILDDPDAAFNQDSGMDDEGEEVDEDAPEGDVEDLEDALDDLKAEFEQMMADEDDMDMDAEKK